MIWSKMKAYLFVAKVRIQSALAYRFNVISTISIQCLLMFAMACFWKAAYGGTGNVSGVGEREMLTYTTISVIMGNLLTMGVEGRIESSVRSGSVALDMLKPVNIYGIYLAEDLGDMAVAFFQTAVPLFLIGSALFGMIVLVGGQLLVEHVYSYTIPVSVFITVGGGVYFLYLLLTKRRT